MLEVTFINKQVNSQVNHQDLERISHKGINLDSCEEVLLCWTVLLELPGEQRRDGVLYGIK